MNRCLPLCGILCVFLVFALSGCAPGRNPKGFHNPILAGFYPDPSICRVGGDYYLVNSTFSYYPGIPVFHSKNLVDWKLIGHVMNRPEQLNLDGLGVSRGIFAPTIRHHEGVFYVTCTLVDGGGNFIVTSKTPDGPWSDPVWMPEINGIDPSMFFDEDGKAYILYNSIAPDDKPLYDGHRTIRMRAFDIDHMKSVGEEKILVNGGSDIGKKPVWIEGPHIYRKDGAYYLTAAEGGTGDNHSQVIFRSRAVGGPYVPYQNNPILTQRHLDPKRNLPITSTGHADFVQTETGQWWAVFLGCRPYRPFEEGCYNTGRETFLAPVRWTNGWPVINPDHDEVQYFYPCPIPSPDKTVEFPYSGNFRIVDQFDTDVLNPNWVFLRTPRVKWHDLAHRKGFLSMQVRPESFSGNGNPSFIGRRQQHACGSAALAMDFSPKAEYEKAGLLVFQNEKHFYFLCKSLEGNEPVVQLYRSGTSEESGDRMELIASEKLGQRQPVQEIHLRMEARGNVIAFFYSARPDAWTLLKDNVDARFLSTKMAGGFVGCMIAMAATSLGQPSDNTACFDWFECRGDDEAYK